MSSDGDVGVSAGKAIGQIFRHIRYGKGVVGKLTTAVVAGQLVGGVALSVLNTDWMVLGGLLGLLGFSAFALTKILSFAERNPAIAVLEDREVIDYVRLEQQAATKANRRGRQQGARALKPRELPALPEPTLEALKEVDDAEQVVLPPEKGDKS